MPEEYILDLSPLWRKPTPPFEYDEKEKNISIANFKLFLYHSSSYIRCFYIKLLIQSS